MIILPPTEEQQKAEAMKFIIDQEIETRLKRLSVKTTSCWKCGKPLFWITTSKGKLAPITLQLLNHFIDCPYANEFRKN